MSNIQQIPISALKSANNHRKVGDTTELRASIAEHGILEPLLVLAMPDGQFQVVAGHWRLQAAKELKYDSVPCLVMSKTTEENATAIALVENIQRKDLTPIEEGEAFIAAAKKFAGDYDRLAKSLGKSREYIGRRVALLHLIPEARKALETGKIQLGHAVILAATDAEAQKKYLPDLIKEKTSVHDFVENMEYEAEDQRKNFKKLGIPLPKVNVQAILDQTGEKINGVEMGQAAHNKALKDAIKEQTEDFTKKGAKVINYEQAQAMMMKGAMPVQDWQPDHKTIMATGLFKSPEKFCICIDVKEGRVQKFVLKTEKAKVPEREGKSPADRKAQLTRHVRDIRRKLLRDYCRAKMPLDAHAANAMTCYELMRRIDWSFEEDVEHFAKLHEFKGLVKDGEFIGSDGLGTLYAPLFKKTDKELVAIQHALSNVWFNTHDTDELEAMAEALNFDAKKEFKVTEQFLNLHTNAELDNLAKEMGVDISNLQKKSEKVEAILSAKTAGKVPKIFEDAHMGEEED